MTKEINLISISGAMNSGKDTVAKIILQLLFKGVNYDSLQKPWKKHQYENLEVATGWKIKKFAYKLKKRVEISFPNEFSIEKWEISGREYREAIIPSLGITRRKLLQLEGEKMREIHEDYWIEALFSDYHPTGVNQLVSDQVIRNLGNRKDDYCPRTDEAVYPFWCVTDCRFENEAKAIKERGGIVVRVNRPHIVVNTGIHKNDESNIVEIKLHASETSLDSWNFDYVIDNNGSMENLVEEVIKMMKKFAM